MNSNDTIVLTAIYSNFWGTEHFKKSVSRVGLELYNVFPPKTPYRGNGFIYQYFYKAFLDLKDKYKTVIYSDGADTVFQKAFVPPDYKIIYSTEKAIYPSLPHLHDLYAKHYLGLNTKDLELIPWRFLNGGNWCGPIDLLIKFYERYGLNKLTGDINGQREQAEAFMKAIEDGFPIEFDLECKYFQTIAFEHVGDFSLAEDGKTLINNITGSTPCIVHGNGRTEMGAIYKRWK